MIKAGNDETRRALYVRYCTQSWIDAGVVVEAAGVRYPHIRREMNNVVEI